MFFKIFALQTAPAMGAAVTPWHGSIMDRVSLDDMPHKGNSTKKRDTTGLLEALQK